MQKHLTFFIALFIGFSSLAQVNLDSLWSVWNDQTQADTSRLKAMKEIAWDGYLFSQADSAFYFAKLQYDLAESVNNKKWMADALTIQGSSFYIQGNYKYALNYYKRSLKIFKEIGDKQGISNVYNNIGSIYTEKSNYEEAINYYKESLKISLKIGDKPGIAKYYNLRAKIFYKQGNYEESLNYYKKSLDFFEEIGNKQGISNIYNNIGSVYKKQKNFAESLKYHKSSLKIKKEIGDKYAIAGSLGNIGRTYLEQGNYQQALTYLTEALSISKDINVIRRVSGHSHSLFETYKKVGKYKQALEMYELHIINKDSLAKQDAIKELIHLEAKRKYEEHKLTDSLKHEQKILLHQSEAKAQKQIIKREKVISNGLIVFAIVVMFSLGLIFISLKKTKLQKALIETQHKDLTSSITYAKRIQAALLPTSSAVKESFKESFILYLPKDIVAGDFYWLEKTKDTTLFAVADCTGHGVPGAMVSVICNNGLNRSVREYNITQPSKILDKTREIVIQEFAKSSEDIQDGMDIALCSIKGDKLNYSGAHNPLIVIRNKEVIKVKADRQPIGTYIKPEDFTNHTLDIEKDDMIYIFTDGFVDQFGGEKGKKYRLKNLLTLLTDISTKVLSEQNSILKQEFASWKGTEDQIDDVCVMGVRV